MRSFTLIIGNKNFSSWSLRAWLTLKTAGVTFKEVLIPLRQPNTSVQISAFSPSGLVPALEHGSLTIWDSLAIGEYIAEIFPVHRLWPEEESARAVARSISAEMHSGFQALRLHLPMDIHGNFKGFHIPADAQQNIDRILGAWQSAKETYGKKGDFLFGQFSLADIMYAPVVTRFRTYNVPVKEQICRDYMDAIWNHPSMQEWIAAAQEHQTA